MVQERTPAENRDIATQIDTFWRGAVTGVVADRCGGSIMKSNIDDIVQTVFLLFHLALDKGKFPDLTAENVQQEGRSAWIGSWLFRAANWTRIGLYRDSKREVASDDPPAISVTNMELEFEFQRELILSIAPRICPPRECEALLLAMEGKTDPEIAEHMRLKAGSARAYKTRAIQRVREYLRANGF